MDVLTGITLAAPAGLNAYIPLLALAAAQRVGWVQLREPFDLMGTWWAILLITLLLIIEIFADKVPAVDHVNDLIQSFVRPAAGGFLALSTADAGRIEPWLALAAGVLLAGSVHAVKASARPFINAASGGAGAPIASTVEDAGAVGMSALAIAAPLLGLITVIASIGAAIWGLRRWRRRHPAAVAADGVSPNT